MVIGTQVSFFLYSGDRTRAASAWAMDSLCNCLQNGIRVSVSVKGAN